MTTRVAGLLALLGLIAHCPAEAILETSYRVRAMGSELAWFVSDGYTDLQYNPAEIAGYPAEEIFTNFSNLTGANHQILKGEEVAYSDGSGAFLGGAILRLGEWGIGLIGDYWRSEQWTERGYSMSRELSTYYQFNWNQGHGATGTTIVDHNTDTLTPDDDYRTVEKRSGAYVQRDDHGADLKLIIGRGCFGFAYEFTYRNAAQGMGFTGETYYSLLEIGEESPLEAVEAAQQEANDGHNLYAQHRFSLGYATSIGHRGKLDLVGGLYHTHDDDYRVRTRAKQIDFDPDHDGQSYKWYYYGKDFDQYDFQESLTEDGDLLGWGTELRGRGSWDLHRHVHLRMLGTLDFRSIDTEEYRSDEASLECMTAFPEEDGFQSHEQTESHGTAEDRYFASRLGLGLEVHPERKLQVNIAAAWRYYLMEHLIDAVQKSASGTEPAVSESRHRQHALMLPIGVEYTINRRYALRLGTLSSFRAEKSWSDAHGTATVLSAQTVDQTRSGSFKYSTTTTYSYGIGIHLTPHIHVDVAGISDLSEIEEFLLSFVYRL